MFKLHVPIHLALLITSPALFAYPHVESTFQQTHRQEIPCEGFGLNYDDVLHLLSDIESNTIENYSAEQLERVTYFISFLAQQGMLPGEYVAAAELKNDSVALHSAAENFFHYASNGAGEENHTILLCKHKKKKHKDKHKEKHEHKSFCTQVKDFFKKHRKAIIIGAAVVVGATVVVIAVAATSTATALAVASAAAKAATASQHSSSTPSAGAPQLESALEDQIISFKETLVVEEHLSSDIPIEENLRTLSSLFAHQSSQELQQQLLDSPLLAQEIETMHWYNGDFFSHLGHEGIDQIFSTDYASIYTTPQTDFNTLAYQARGEQALKFGYYEQAVHDLGKALDLNPSNPLAHLERGVAHFNLGHYDHSVNDYQQYIAQKIPFQEPFSLSSFTLGFAKGLPSGIYDSGEGTLLFLADLITHPIHTSGQVWESLVILKDLVKTNNWETIAETLSPQVHDLVVNWDQFSSYERGKLAGYALGRHGADFLLPAAAAKAAKTCKELVTVSRNLRLAEKTIVLESISNLENGVKIAEIIQSKTSFVAEKLGFYAHEIAQLETARKVEGKLNDFAKNVSNSAQDIKFTNHALQRAIERGVSRESIVNALSSPLKVEEIKIDNLGRSSQRMVGQKAEVVINPETQQIVSVNPTSTKKLEKLINDLTDAKDRAK